MSYQAEARALRKTLRRDNFTVELNSKGHWEVQTEDGERVSTFSETPSDHRWRANALSDIRRWKRQKELTLRNTP